ncbi:hypothetical protein [Micromonospora sp. NPDC092111]|uniref:hypothetical protein n=1 Tax=Micromonospora sp. NPDC092111 TaxID=3364289 RepID=UPI0037F96F3A
MSETGQPGAATPGEHDDGTGQQDDLARSVSGWAPPATGWSGGADAPGYRETGSPWNRADPTAGWGGPSPLRHGDLPASFPVPAAGGDAPHNGHAQLNGHGHGDDLPSPVRHPVSAPPADPRFGVDDRRDAEGDRLVVPAQRPASPAEQQYDPEATRHSSDEPPSPRVSRWAEGNLPASAPPAVQVPPVGTAASGFEVPPGLHAPERGDAEPYPADEPRGWAERFPTEAGPHGWAERFAAGSPTVGPGEPPTAGRRSASPADEPDWSGPSWNRPSWGGSWAPSWSRDEDQPPGRRTRAERAAEWSAEPARPYEPVRAEPARPYEPVRAEPARPYEPVRSETPRPYELTRSEPVAAPEPAEPAVDRSGRARPGVAPAADLPAPERPGADRIAPDRDHPVGDLPAAPRPTTDRAALGRSDADRSATGRPVERPAWAGGRPAAAPPAPREEPTAGPSVPRDERDVGAPPGAGRADQPFRLARDEPAGPPPVAGRADQPFRLRSVPTESTTPTDHGGHPPDPGAPATNGPRRLDRTPPAPAPTSAPPYAARRSAPDPQSTADPAGDDRRPERGTAVLPQRVPAEPDVPVVPEPPAVEPPAETPELARIATHLRRDDEPAPLRERPEGFDVNAILDAVREVAGVRDAALRRTPAGAHSLRLDLADGADPAEVSRMVARLLQERMGLAAAPQNLPGMPAAPTPPPLRRRTVEPRSGEESTPTERRDPGRPGMPAVPTGRARAVDPSSGEERPTGGLGRPVTDRPQGGPGRDAEEQPAGDGRAEQPATVAGVPRRRRQATAHRGRASVEEAAPGSALPPTGSPATLNASYSGGQLTTTESAPSRPLDTGGVPGPRVVIDHVQVSTFGLDATVEVRLLAAGEPAAGHATGPAVDGYVLRLCAVAAAAAVDELLRHAERTADRGRCFVEHAAVVPFGNCEVATVVVLLVCDGWVEQLAGSALVAGDPRQAVVRATLAAVNRRLEALLA